MWFKGKRYTDVQKRNKEREKVIHSGSSEVGSPQVAASRGLFKPIPFCGYFWFWFWFWSGSCEASQRAACWCVPPTRNSGSPGRSSGNTAAPPSSLCSVQSARRENRIQPCISATTTNQRRRNRGVISLFLSSFRLNMIVSVLFYWTLRAKEVQIVVIF